MAQSFSKLNIRGTARPIRVAYLVTLEECPNELLDEIFDEAYSRWGGRRTLVVPSTETGIDPRYTQWLKLFDPDRQYYLSDRRLDPSIQALCDSQILFQGREWQCRKCYNRNWVSIEHLSRSLKCEVCNDSRSAPVSGDWSFRLNAFVLEAYRDHGIEAVIWTLWILSQRARESFYFAPSLTLWDGYPEDGVDPVAEIDALAVVDGELYLCEAKASSRLSKDELNQLASVCLRVRPDVLLLASMDGADLESRASGLRESLRGVMKVEIIRFDHDDLDDRSLLPH